MPTLQVQFDSENIRKNVDEQIREETLELERLRSTAGIEFQSHDTLLFRSCFGGSIRDDADLRNSINKVLDLYSNRSSGLKKNESTDYTDK